MGMPTAIGACLIVGATLISSSPALAEPAPAVQQTQEQLTAAQKRAQLQRAKRQRQAQRADRARASLVRTALRKKGARYISGASGPNVFDCSGFTMWVYRTAIGKNIPHYSGAQMARTKRVSRSHLKPGDLMFFGPGGSQHVSMYIGKGKMIHATNPRSGVRVDSINMGYYRARFAGAGRLIKG